MDIIVLRTDFTEESTISEILIDGSFECYAIEDLDRELDSDMPLSEITDIKVMHKTAIPTGRYKVVITRSNRFSAKAGKDVFLPLLLDVPGFAGVRIHSGNYAADSSGCILPGMNKMKNTVVSSRIAFNSLFNKIQKALNNKEEVFITIKSKKNATKPTILV